MKTVLSVIFFLCLVFASTASGFTGYDYAPMRNGSWIDYAWYKIETSWNPDTLELAVTSREYLGTVRVIHGQYQCHECFGDAVLFKSVFPNYDYLTDGGSVVNGTEYLGEARNNHGNISLPFIAKLAKDPHEGQIINTCSSIRSSCSFSAVEVKSRHCWRYRTIAHYDTWGHWSDVWRTGLVEYGGGSFNQTGADHHYNYAWARNIGMIDLWYSYPGPDGRRVGYELYAVGFGGLSE